MSITPKRTKDDDLEKFVDTILIVDIEKDTRELNKGEDDCFILKSQWGTYYCKGYEKGANLMVKSVGLIPDKIVAECQLLERFDNATQQKIPTVEVSIRDNKGNTLKRKIYSIPLEKAKRDGNKCIVPLEDKSDIFCKAMNEGMKDIAEIIGIDYGDNINTNLYTSNCGIMADVSNKEEKAKILAGIRRSKRNLW